MKEKDIGTVLDLLNRIKEMKDLPTEIKIWSET